MPDTDMTQAAEALHADGAELRRGDFHITVNTRPSTVESDQVPYAQVVNLAFPGHAHDPTIYYEVTYRNAAGYKHDGTLLDGQSVKVKNGTAFHVTQTNRS
jgi:hypothetical protein